MSAISREDGPGDTECCVGNVGMTFVTFGHSIEDLLIVSCEVRDR